MFGEKLKRRGRMFAGNAGGGMLFAAMIAVFASFAVSGAPVADTSKSGVAADTSKSAAAEKIVNAGADGNPPVVADTALPAVSADSVKADTAPPPALAGISAGLSAGSAPLADSAPSKDTVVSADAGTTASSDGLADADGSADDPFDGFERPPKQPFFSFKDSKPARWLFANAFYILFFAGCLAVIAATVYFFLSRQDKRRFLTTTRLSVLDKMVQKGCRYIESNYMNPELSVSLVCKELVTGEAYLETLFVKEIGVDVRDFIAQVRVDRIKKILAKGMQGGGEDMDIDNICKQCGFPDRLTAERTFAKLCKGVGVGGYLESLKPKNKS